MERDCLLSRNTSLQGHVDKAKAATSQLAHQKFLDAKAFQSQIIGHKEEHVFSIAQLRFQLDKHIEEAFSMADRVTEKVLWKKRNKSMALLIKRSKYKLKEKNPKGNLEKERRGQEVLWLHPQERWRLNLDKNQYQEMN